MAGEGGEGVVDQRRGSGRGGRERGRRGWRRSLTDKLSAPASLNQLCARLPARLVHPIALPAPSLGRIVVLVSGKRGRPGVVVKFSSTASLRTLLSIVVVGSAQHSARRRRPGNCLDRDKCPATHQNPAAPQRLSVDTTPPPRFTPSAVEIKPGCSAYARTSL